jgi:hypothetical protein
MKNKMKTESPSAELRRIAPDHPIFRVEAPPRELVGSTADSSES